jgi:hypothetical protein
VVVTKPEVAGNPPSMRCNIGNKRFGARQRRDHYYRCAIKGSQWHIPVTSTESLNTLPSVARPRHGWRTV